MSCTCQDMLSIANQKLATPNDPHFTFIRDYWSCTGASIASKHRMDKLMQEYHDMLAELDRQTRKRLERVQQSI